MNIAIVEISKSHEECIYTQVKFIKDSGHTIDLILHKALESQINAYRNLAKNITYITPSQNGFFAKIQQQKSLSKELSNYDLVIFNTASSSKLVRNTLLLLLFSKVKCVGILHNSKKLRSSFTQALISLKIKKYFVLNDTIASLAEPKKGIKVASFYPIFFPKHCTSKSVSKPDDEIWITIPGRIDWKRRDYWLLISVLKENKKLGRIKFIILGKLDKTSEEGAKFWQLINANNLEHYFLLFNTFISNEIYHSYLTHSNYIMPLLSSNKEYLEFKISGSFNLAFAYKKALLCKSYFNSLTDLQENAFFYEKEGLYDLLKKIENNSLKEQTLYEQQKWSYDYQKNKYISFLFQ